MMGGLKAGILGLTIGACGFLATLASAWSQDLGRAVSQIVTIDRQSLFSDTEYGRRVVATVELERQRLASETRKAEAQLVEEEKALTARRAEMEPQAFKELALQFDTKVQALRAEGQAREAEFVRTLETEQAAFFERVGPILGQLVRELGAVVILDRRAILLTTQNIDITRLAVERVDRELGDGADLQQVPAEQIPAPAGDAPLTNDEIAPALEPTPDPDPVPAPISEN